MLNFMAVTANSQLN